MDREGDRQMVESLELMEFEDSGLKEYVKDSDLTLFIVYLIWILILDVFNPVKSPDVNSVDGTIQQKNEHSVIIFHPNVIENVR